MREIGKAIAPNQGPVLFMGEFNRERSAFAFNPDLANGQVVGGQYFMPRQWGPPMNGEEMFELYARSRLGERGLPVGPFVDDWTYHTARGEVHCGSAVVRAPLGGNWWTAAR